MASRGKGVSAVLEASEIKSGLQSSWLRLESSLPYELCNLWKLINLVKLSLPI